MNIYGMFLVCGGADAPALHWLSEAGMRDLYERDRLAGDSPKSRRLVMRTQFGADAMYALPAWVPECMTQIALHYAGDDADLVRGMAAALALGRPLHGTAAPEPVPAPRTAGGPSGGQRARPVKPAPAAPSAPGGFFADIGARP